MEPLSQDGQDSRKIHTEHFEKSQRTSNQAPGDDATPSASVFGLDVSRSIKKTQNDVEDEELEKPNVFQKYAKNETLPVHINYNDSHADKESDKGKNDQSPREGSPDQSMGYMYDRDYASSESSDYGQGYGFVKTGSMYRAHYKLARMKDK